MISEGVVFVSLANSLRGKLCSIQNEVNLEDTNDRIFTSNAAKQLASSAIDVGKNVAKEGAKKALEAGTTAATDVGKKLVKKALTPKSKKILQKFTTQPTTQNINSLIDGSAIEIQNLVKRLNTGMGIKKI